MDGVAGTVCLLLRPLSRAYPGSFFIVIVVIAIVIVIVIIAIFSLPCLFDRALEFIAGTSFVTMERRVGALRDDDYNDDDDDSLLAIVEIIRVRRQSFEFVHGVHRMWFVHAVFAVWRIVIVSSRFQ